MNYLEEDLQNLSAYINEKNFSGSKFLVTGASGLIGSLCVKALANCKNIYIIGAARNPQKIESIFGDKKENVDFIYQDISEPLPEHIECDYIIHTANSTTSKFFMSNPVEVIESIYLGTKRILDYAVNHKIKGIVYLSSMEVFGRIDSHNRIGEEQLGYLDIQNIRSCYSEGKRLAELLCKSYAMEYNVPVKIARLAQTFGAGVMKNENRVFAQFARSAIRGENIILHTSGTSMGNYCYTTDVIRAIILLLKKGENGDVYTVVNEETTRKIVDMAQMVANEFSDGKSKVVFDIPEGNEYGYAPDTQMRLSAEKIKKLGWEPEVSLKEMYRRMIPYL